MAEKAGAAAHRDELLADLRGTVVEVGAGSGLCFAHYPTTVTEVLAVEPEPYFRQMATEAAASVPTAVRVVAGSAEHLPAGDGTFDAAVASLVLCSVPDQKAALAEIRRVLRPGGELRFYEHVRAVDTRLARWQDRVDRIWPRLGAGCHANRDTVEAIESAGFVVETYRRFDFRPGIVVQVVAPHVIGSARVA